MTSPQGHNNPSTAPPATTTPNPTPPQHEIANPLLGAQWNANSVRSKRAELRNHLFQHRLPFLAIQETWLTDKSQFRIPRYSVYRKDREGRGGGLCLLVREDLNAKEEAAPQLSADNPMEIQHVVVWIKNKPIHLYNIYNPPPNRIDPKFLEDIQHPAIVLGDFNAHSPLWNSNHERNRSGQIVEDALVDLANLDNGSELEVMHDSSPPGVQSYAGRGGNVTSTPDVTLCSSSMAESLHRRILTEALGSDHSIIHIHMQTQLPPVQKWKRKMWNFKKAQWEKYARESDEALYKIQIDAENPEGAIPHITSAIIQAMSSCAPRGWRKRRIINNLDETAKEAIRNRKRARQEFCKNRTTRNRISMNKTVALARKRVQEALRRSWRKACDELQGGGAKKVWSMINALRKPKVTATTPMKAGAQVMVLSDTDKANAFCDQYASVANQFKKERGNEKPSKPDRKDKVTIQLATKLAEKHCDDHSLFTAPLTMKELEYEMKKLRQGKSPGKDKIHPEMVNHLGTHGKRKLLELFNALWRKGLYPDAWKIAEIVPILKPNKPPELPASYRPVALTSIVGKLMERIVNSLLMYFLEAEDKLTPYQAAFRKNHQTGDHVASLQQQIIDGLNRDETTVAVFFDFKAAYDSVHHNKLLVKVDEMGIKGKMFLFVKSFLENRRIQVRYNGVLSKEQHISNSVPQGAVVSVALFLIFINNLPDALPENVTKALYADDAAVAVTSSSMQTIQGRINDACNRFLHWTTRNKLTLNYDKIQVVRFTKQREKTIETKPLSLRMDGKELKITKEAQYLGITLDQKMKWRQQVGNTLTEARKRLHALRKVAGATFGPDKATIRTLYRGLVLSKLEYCSEVWGSCLDDTRSEQCERIHNQGLRLVANAGPTTHRMLLYAESGLRPLKHRWEQKAVLRYEKARRMSDSDIVKRAIEDHHALPVPPQKKPRRISFAEVAADKTPCPKSRAPIPTTRRSPIIEAYPLLSVNPILQYDFSKDNENSKFRAALQTIALFPEDDWMHIYTDGARNRNGAGAAYYMPNEMPPIEASFPSSRILFIQEIEAKAILRALQRISLDNRILRRRNIVVFTDSKATIQLFERVLNTPDPPPSTIEDTLSVMRNIWRRSPRCQVNLQYVPAHSEIIGNVKADDLAVKASKLPPPAEGAGASWESARLCTHLYYQWLWREEYKKPNSPSVLFYRGLRPDPLIRDYSNHLPRSEGRVICALRTCRYPTAAYNHRCKRIATPRCQCGEVEDISHFLIRCPLPARVATRKHYYPQGCNILKMLFGKEYDLLRCVKYVRKLNPDF